MTKEQCSSLIERLADKKLSFGCEIITPKWNGGCASETITGTHHGDRIAYECVFRNGTIFEADITKIIGHPVYIGDVLEKIMLEYGKKEGDSLYPYYGVVEQHVQLAEKWAYCGYNKSLQTILEEAEWEARTNHPAPMGIGTTVYDLKSPAKELFLFLDQLFPNK